MSGLRRIAVVSVISAFSLVSLVSSASAQASRVPVGLQLTLNGAEAKAGAKVSVTVGLKNFKGEPVSTADRVDVTIESTLPPSSTRVTIPAGKTSATALIVFERAGIAKLKATSGKLSPGYGVISITRQAASLEASEPYAKLRLAALRTTAGERISWVRTGATTSLKLELQALVSRVVPRNRVWNVQVLVAVVNDRGEPVKVDEDLPVRLAATLGTVVPDSLVIPPGKSSAFVQVTSTAPGQDTISALSPDAEGRAEEHVEYEQVRASKLFLISTPDEVVTSGRSNANITVLLRDEDEHIVAATDRDTRVVLRTTFGALSTASITIPRGRPDSEPISLSSPRAGRATITAIAEGLETDSADVKFVLPFLLIGLAAVGGVGGAVLRTPRGRRRSQLGRSLALGAMLGTIFFALGMLGVPGMIPAIPLQTIEHLTLNEVGACILGLLGGYIGRRFLDDLLIKRERESRAGVAAV
jgi:hypothetical protein